VIFRPKQLDIDRS